MIDVVAEEGWLRATLRIMQLLQMVIQARWIDEPAILTLPYIEKEHLHLFNEFPKCLPWFCSSISNNYDRLSKVLLHEFIDDHFSRVSLLILILKTQLNHEIKTDIYFPFY